MHDKATKKAQEIEKQALKRSRTRELNLLGEKLEEGQLVFWPETERGVPNELVRCAVFSAKNRREARRIFRANEPMRVPVLGGGEVIYIGEELRQDDETVWMQLVHLAKENRSEFAVFNPHSFIKSVGWPNNGASYARLLSCIRRLATAGIELYSARFERGMSTKLIVRYEYSNDAGQPWKVQVFDREDHLLFLFDKLYSRLEWETRLALPDGLATWLHGFFASHRDPYPHKIETLAVGAGLTIEVDDPTMDAKLKLKKRQARMREIKRLMKTALEALKGQGFIVSYEISPQGLVSVVRAA